MQRGDVVIVAAAGDYGKPRPAVIVQTLSTSIPPGATSPGGHAGDGMCKPGRQAIEQ